MALLKKSTQIDGQTFTVQQMPGMLAMKTWPRVLKVLGAALKRLPPGVTMGGGVEQFMAMDAAVLGDLVIELCERLHEDELEVLSSRLLADAWLEKEEALTAIDLGQFKGGVFGVYRALWFAIEVNYASFLNGLGGLGKQETASPSETSTT
jgi:hypothetical protein